MSRILPILICLVVLVASSQRVVAQSVGKANISPAELSRQSLQAEAYRQKAEEMKAEHSLMQHRLTNLQKRRDESISRYEHALRKLNDAEENLGKLEMSAESYAEIVKMLQTRRVELVIQIEGIKARLETLTQLAKERSDTSKGTLEQVVRFHAESVQIAEKLLAEESTRRDENSPHVLERELQLKKANLDLALAKSELAKASSAVNPELISLTTDRAEKSAQLKIVQELLAEVAKARPWIKEISSGRDDVKQLSERLIALDSEFSRMTMEMDLLRERVQQNQTSPESTENEKQK